ncbi:MAG: PUA domain-containing protein, partial [Pseudomonadota bacterium]
SDVDGLYTANPKVKKTAKHIPFIDKITPEVEAMAGDAGSGLSKGGMITKVIAARIATEGGCAVAHARWAEPPPMQAIQDGAPVTWFAAQTDPQQARKRWIGSMKPKGSVTVDAGASDALSRGKSLLPAGVISVSGSFGRGEVVAIMAHDGTQLGQGLIRYTSAEARQIMGHRSADIVGVLGYEGRAALVHRDDMVL